MSLPAFLCDGSIRHVYTSKMHEKGNAKFYASFCVTKCDDNFGIVTDDLVRFLALRHKTARMSSSPVAVPPRKWIYLLLVLRLA